MRSSPIARALTAQPDGMRQMAQRFTSPVAAVINFATNEVITQAGNLPQYPIFNFASLRGTTTGIGREFTSTSGYIFICPDSQIPSSQITIVVRYGKVDSTNRASRLFAASIGTSSDLCAAHAPYSDGVVYWDFGGNSSGATRLTVSGQTFELATWVFSTGPRGMEIWKNGVRVASNASTPTRTNAGGQAMVLGSDGVSTADLVDYELFAMFSKQLTYVECEDLSLNPWQMFQAPDPRTWFLQSASSGILAVGSSGGFGGGIGTSAAGSAA